MGDFDQNRQPDSHHPGLNQSPSGSSWPDADQRTPRARLWPIAVSVLVLVGVVVAVILLTQS